MSLDKKFTSLVGSFLASGMIVCAQTNNITTEWKYNHVTGREYALTIPANWQTLRSIAHSVGGELVSINDATENQWLVDTFKPSGVEYLAVGLNDEALEGNFVWANGEPVTYLNWNSGEPNNTTDGNYTFMATVNNVQGMPAGKWGDATYNIYPGIVERIANPPKFASIKKINDNVYLQFETISKKTYFLESSTNLSNWDYIFTFPGSVGTNLTTIFLPGQVEDRKFYRTTSF